MMRTMVEGNISLETALRLLYHAYDTAVEDDQARPVVRTVTRIQPVAANSRGPTVPVADSEEEEVDYEEEVEEH
jgi:hypothetical protein